MERESECLRPTTIVVPFILLMFPGSAIAGPICSGFWDCPFLMALSYGYLFCLYIAPALAVLGLLALGYVRMQYGRGHHRWQMLFGALTLVGASSTIVVQSILYANRQVWRQLQEKHVEAIAHYGLQVYRATRFPGHYAVTAYYFLENPASVEAHLSKDDTRPWGVLREFMIDSPNAFGLCRGEPLGGTACSLLDRTADGTPVYAGRHAADEGGRPVLYVVKGTTGFSIEKDWSQDPEFLPDELTAVFELLDSLSPVGMADLRNYKTNVLDNL